MTIQSKASKEIPNIPKNYWRSLSDEQLLKISFTTENPEELSDLIENVPTVQEHDPPFVEFGYDFRGSKRNFIRCAHCTYPNHLYGFVVRAPEGRFLVGNDCAEKIYGVDFTALKRDYENARAHADNLKRWRNLQAGLPDFIEYLSVLQKCAAVRIYRDTKRQFRDALPRLFGELMIACTQREGSLSIEDKVRDFNAEIRDEERYEREMEEWQTLTATEKKKRRRDGRKPSEPRKPIYQTFSRQVYIVRAKSFFSQDTLPHDALAMVLSAFDRLSSEISGATVTQTKWEGKRDSSPIHKDARHLFATTFASTFKQTNTLLDQIELQLERLADFGAFFGIGSLTAVVDWVNQNPQLGLNLTASSRMIMETAAPNRSVRLDASFSLPSRAPLVAFRKAVNSTA